MAPREGDTRHARCHTYRLQHEGGGHVCVCVCVGGGGGTQPEFPFPNSEDPPGTPTDSEKKKNLSFLLNIFKSESVERTHLYSYVFH